MPSLRYITSLIIGIIGLHWRNLVRILTGPWRSMTMIPWFSLEKKRMTINHHASEFYPSERVIINELILGRYVFAGRRVEIGEQNPFVYTPPSKTWHETLLSFRWFIHLLKDPGQDERACIQRLLRDWIATPFSFYRHTDSLTTQSLRIDLLVRHNHTLQTLMDDSLKPAFTAKLYADIRRLYGRILITHDISALKGVITLRIAAIIINELKWLSRDLKRQLDKRLNALILSCGGPIDRNPDTLFSITLGLIHLNRITLALGEKPSKAVLSALDYCQRLLITLKMGDGRLAMFHGAGVTDFDDVTLLGSQGFLPAIAPMITTPFGYARLDQGQLTALIDVGTVPPLAHAINTHASLLALEVTSGAKRLVVSAGTPLVDREQWRQVIRETSAHSGISVGNLSTGLFTPKLALLNGERALITSADNIICESHDLGDGPMIRSAHNAYQSAFGLSIERRVQFLFSGREIRGQDFFHQTRIKLGNNPEFKIRFHMSHESKVSQTSDDPIVYIDLGEGEIWEFNCPDVQTEIEESVTVSSLKIMRRTTQIVLSGHVRDTPRVVWSFRQHNLPA